MLGMWNLLPKTYANMSAIMVGWTSEENGCSEALILKQQSTQSLIRPQRISKV